MKPEITICCVKWGDKYGPEYVRILKAMLDRNLTVPYYFRCFTDNTKGLDGIKCYPIPNKDGLELRDWWGIISMFKPDLETIIPTDKLLFLALDLVIVDNIDCIATFDSDFCICKDWYPKFRYNDSVFLLKLNSQLRVWEEFNEKSIRQYSVGGSQAWIFAMAKDADLWPKNWVKSYQLQCMSLDKCKPVKIVVFHGPYNPDRTIKENLFKSDWVKEYWHEQSRIRKKRKRKI